MLIETTVWALYSPALDALVTARAAFVGDQDKLLAFVERTSSDDGPRFTVSDEGVAHIPVIGVLTSVPDFFLRFMDGGNAVYGDIVEAVRSANANNAVKTIVLQIDSPGGEISGLHETAEVIAASEKPIEAHVTNLAASAAFALAAATDKIVLQNPMVMTGAIGVVTRRFVSDTVVNLRSSGAPKKNPDADTPEGHAAIVEELDAVEKEFVAIVAKGRGVSSADVLKDFGQGGLVIAADAITAGMADEISTTEASASGGARSTLGATMDLETLKVEHPALYAMIFALGIAEGTEAGKLAEKGRVEAHLISGEANGPKAMEYALACIADGTEYLGAVVAAKYQSFGATAGALAARDLEDGDLADAGKPSAGADADAQAVKDKAEREMLARVVAGAGADVSKIPGLAEVPAS